MTPLARGLTSSVGSKAVVAATGAALLLFVLVHMAGNLQIYAGQEAINAYAAQLKSMPGVLWALRAGLLAVALVHVGLALRIAAANRAARPVRYAVAGVIQRTPASRSMTVTGLMLAAFVVYHLAHFTWGWVLTDAHRLVDAQGRPDVFSMMVLGFRQPAIAVAYVVAMGLLGLHLLHGAASVFQSLGLQNRVWAPRVRCAGTGLAWLIVVGNASMPIAVQLGLVVPPAGVG